MRRRLVLPLIVLACGRTTLELPAGAGDDDETTDAPPDAMDDGPPGDPTNAQSTNGNPTGMPPDPSASASVSDSVSDTASDSVSITLTSVSDDGPGPFDVPHVPCGDGELDRGEACDDGNTRNDDACTSQCTIPFEVLWTVTHDGAAHNADAAYDVVIDGAGNIYAVGEQSEIGQGRNLWLQQYAPDGTAGWTFVYDGPESMDDTGFALAATADGDFVVAGVTESDATGDDILVMRIDGMSPAIEWMRVVDGPGSGPNDYDERDEAFDVLVDPSGAVMVTGHTRMGPLDWDVWLARFDGAGAEQWTQTFAGPAMGQDSGRALALDLDGTLRVLVEVEVDADQIVGALLSLDIFGMLVGNDELGIGVGDLAIAPGSDVVVAGHSGSDDDFNADYEIHRYDAGLGQEWGVTLDGAGNDDRAEAVAIGAGETIYVVGQSARDGESQNGRLLVFDADGEVRWGDEHNAAPADLNDAFHGVAETADGDVVVVGYESVLGEQRNALVRKYRPL